MLNKRYIILLGLLFLSLLLVASFRIPIAYATSNYEDYTEYTEVDGSGYITVTNSTYIDFDGHENADAYLYFDKLANHFDDDFEHQFDARWWTSGAGDGACWALANDLNDLKGLEDGSKDFLAIYFDGTKVYMKESYSGSTYTNNTSISSLTWYYYTTKRTNDVFNLEVYNNSARTNDYLEADLTLTLHSIVEYQYIFAANSYNTGGGGAIDMQVANLDLGYLAYYHFYGLYDESDGTRNGAVNVTAYYSSESSETFEVDGHYMYGSDTLPQYFHFELGANDREYWVSTGETSATIYIFDDTLTEYTITFLDFAGVLDDYSFVLLKCTINGTEHTVEKRQADINDRVVVNLIQGKRYNIVISDAITYDYGAEYFGADTTVEIILRGLEFPQEIILAYRHVRMYALRRDNYSAIDILYHDLDDETDHVDCRIEYANGTVANQTTLYVSMFNYTWTSAVYNITYYVEMDAFHDTYGELNYRQVMYRGGFGISPWKIGWLGTIPDMETTVLIPIFLIFGAALAFSKVNAYMGAFLATLLAILFTWWGWVNISASMLIMALVFTILMALGYKKKRTIGI